MTRHRPPTPSRRRAGVTLVEMLIAVTILAIGLLSLAGLGLATARATKGGGVQVTATSLAQARFDSLASLPCQTLATSTTLTGAPPVVRGIRERWAVVDGKNRKNLLDSLWVPGRTRPLVFLSVLPCRE